MPERGYIGKPIPRLEDRRLILGRGRYTDDLKIDGALYAAFVRSPHAHARVRAIRTGEAESACGVVAVLTGKEYAADGHRGIPQAANPADNVDPSRPAFDPATTLVVVFAQAPIAVDLVRHVGEAIALVVAESAAAARDGADLVEVDYEPLPAVVTAGDALRSDAPQLWEHVTGNLALDAAFGDASRTERAFARAHTVVEHTFKNQRLFAAQMEPRAAIGRYDPERDVYTLIAGSQGVGRQSAALAEALAVSPERIEVVCPDVGGGFGVRTSLHPEAVLVTWAARRVGRPVRWTSDRSEGFLTDMHGRDIVVEAALALDAQGKILGWRETLIGNAGAYPVSYAPLQNAMRIATTVYDVPAAFVRVLCALTNTTPTVPYRGAGRPEATHAMERLLDMAARRLNIDRIEIRRRNLIRKEQLPYHSVMGLTYDSGDFLGNMERALDVSDWRSIEARRAESKHRGRLRGIGIGNYLESPVGAPREKVTLRVKGEGSIEIVTGTQSSGQGHETVYAQVVADLLGVPLETVRVTMGDTRLGASGGGTHSNRSMRIAGTMLVEGCEEIIEKSRAIIAEQFESRLDEVVFDSGIVRHIPTGDEFTLFAVASLRELTATEQFNGRIPAFPTGCAVCELEVDRASGEIAILRYTQIDDVGQAINPLLVHGQTHGGIAQGAGQSLWEELAFDTQTGALQGGSFMDYAVPRASDLPHLTVELAEDPTHGNPLRVKGGGEGGVTPAPAAIIGALVDALQEFGIEHMETPASAPKVWEVLAASGDEVGS
jgi:aerobic carbon-monoxide dehydrogenase large subunit